MFQLSRVHYCHLFDDQMDRAEVKETRSTRARIQYVYVENFAHKNLKQSNECIYCQTIHALIRLIFPSPCQFHFSFCHKYTMYNPI